MILTVTPNPAVDLDFIVNDFRPGGRYRAEVSRRSPGGAGINISIILRRLGLRSIATGFLAGFDGAYILDALRREGITTSFVHTRGETRVNVCVIDTRDNTETRLIEPGIQVSEEDQASFLRNYERMLGRVDLVAMGGSLPSGSRPTFYTDMLRLARNNSIPTMLYSGADDLQAALTESATIVKLNVHDKSKRNAAAAEEAFAASARELHLTGTEWVVALLAKGKAAFSTPKGAWIAEVPEAEMLYIYATEDALMSGMLAALQERADSEGTVRFSTACYWECATRPEKFPPSRVSVEERSPRVLLSRIS